MADTGPASDGTQDSGGDSATVGLVAGWSVTALGVLVVAVTVGVSLYLIVSAEPGIQFVGWFFTMLFFGAFPAMMGLGLIVWGGRIVRRVRSKLSRG